MVYDKDHKDQQITRLQDERAELYGRLGFLQARVQDLEQQVKLLSAPTIQVGKSDDPAPTSTIVDTPDPAPTSTTNHPAPEQNGPDSASYTRRSRPWWHFWAFW